MPSQTMITSLHLQHDTFIKTPFTAAGHPKNHYARKNATRPFCRPHHLASLEGLLGLLQQGDGHFLRQEGLASIVFRSWAYVDVGLGADHVLNVPPNVVDAVEVGKETG